MALTDSKLARWCDGLIEAGWLAAVISAPLFFNIHSERVFEPDKLTLLRSIAVLMLTAWLVKFIDLQGWHWWKRLRWRDESSIWRMPFVLPVVILIIVYLVSTAISVTPRISWAGSYQRLQGTYTTLAYIVIFLLMIATMRSRAQVRRLVTVVIITSIPISFYGLLQHFELDPLPWGGNTQLRVAGHMGNAIFIAAYLIMAVPLTVARIIDAFTSILGDEELATADVIRSSIYIFTLAIQLITIYWSGSRGPWIGLAVAIFAFILIVLVTLRDAATGPTGGRLAEGARALALVVVGAGSVYLLATFALGAITRSGRLPSLSGPMGSFVAFAGSIFVVVLTIFIMIAARRGWRWLWLSWLMLTLLGAGWLAAFNFAESLQEPLDRTPVLGSVTDALVEWRDLPAIGRLGRLLESDSGTGKVRVLIWEGALDLLAIHEPLRFPNGERDSFNLLRPLFGYGPESMYVAYNRFYPPELATIEARNASPDRSHNETFDALVITGGLGFLTWQALYISIFYFGFRWLGVVRSRRDTFLLIGFWILGALLASILVTQAMGLEFVGVAVPLGSILGLVVYLIYYALSAQGAMDVEEVPDPFHVDRLLMIGLVAAVLAHYVEIHFGIAIAATRTHFFVYAGLLFIVGYWLPRQKELADEPGAVSGRKRRILRRRARATASAWAPILLSALVLAFILGILGYEFTTYSLPPGKVIESPADLTAGEIFHQSFLLNAGRDFVDSPFVYLMLLLTWTLGALAMVSEMVKSGELDFSEANGRIKPGRLQMAGATYAVLFVAAMGLRFVVPRPAVPSTSALLGRSLLLIWAGLSAWAAYRLFTGRESARLLGGAVAFAGLLFSLPILIAGATIPALILVVACALLLYLLWDPAWGDALLPSAALAFIALSLGLFYAYWQASTLRASLFFQNSDTAATAAQLRVTEAEQASSFLIIFYVFTISLMLLAAFASSWNGMGRVRRGGTMAAYAGVFVLFILALVVINRTNMRIVQADVIYKRAKPFDNSATRSRNLEEWDAAVAIYERAVDLVPNEDFYYLFLGRAYLEQSTVTTDTAEQAELLKEAEKRLIDAQTINPLNTDHTANLARLNTRWVQLSQNEVDRQQRLETAEAYYEDALALSPQNSIIRNEYGRLAFDLKRDCEEAIDIFERSIEIDPFYEATYFGLGEIYMACAAGAESEQRGDYFEEAVARFDEGLAIKDRDARVWLQLAQAHHELDQYDDALGAYQEAKARNEGNQIPDWNIDFWMATVMLDKGDEAGAEGLARQAMAVAPNDAASQIRAFLNGFVDEPVELPTTASAGNPETGDRPLATLEPIQRNGYYPAQPPFVLDLTKDYEAIITTEKGEMRFRLYDDVAPLTVNNFVYLANQGFYDGVTFHRVIEGFMAQGGDPTGTGRGGPGYVFPDEVNTGLSFDRRGLLAMANAGPDTNGSQFFITFVPTPELDGRHTIFGELMAGDEVLGSLSLRNPETATTSGDVILRVDTIESGG